MSLTFVMPYWDGQVHPEESRSGAVDAFEAAQEKRFEKEVDDCVEYPIDEQSVLRVVAILRHWMNDATKLMGEQ